MSYLFTSESVSEGHPDKVADQISDALLDEFLRQDSNSKVACETLVTTGLTVLSGEVKTKAYVDVQKTARKVINKIGYTKAEYQFDGNSCGVMSAIHEQSPDINQGVERENIEEQGAGDQGMMFGYAINQTDNYMPIALYVSHILLEELAVMRRESKVNYLRPDSQSQVTVEYADDNSPIRIDTVVISTQHDDFISPDDDSPEAQKAADDKMLGQIYDDMKNILIPMTLKRLPKNIQKLFDAEHRLLVNPTGKFVIGGPHGDTGLTGRKIIVDTYGGKGAHGGGAFSGKDPSKVDRSAAYATRHIAKNLVAAGVADEVLVQVAYAIGVAEPVGLYVNTYGTSKVNLKDGEIAEMVKGIFDMRPAKIIERLGLKYPIYLPTASYGHMGREAYTKEITLNYNGKEEIRKVDFFAWEKLDYVDQIKAKFNL